MQQHLIRFISAAGKCIMTIKTAAAFLGCCTWWISHICLFPFWHPTYYYYSAAPPDEYTVNSEESSFLQGHGSLSLLIEFAHCDGENSFHNFELLQQESSSLMLYAVTNVSCKSGVIAGDNNVSRPSIMIESVCTKMSTLVKES